MNIEIKAGMQGVITMMRCRPTRDYDGDIATAPLDKLEVKEQKEFTNLITDMGFERFFGSVSYTQANICAVGTGTTPPTPSDTQMEALVSATTTRDSSVSGIVSDAWPYYLRTGGIWRFSGIDADLTEVGVGWATNLVNGLFARSLIKDSNGTPTVFTVTSEDVVLIRYEIRLYMPELDSVQTVTFGGTTGGTFECTTRASQALRHDSDDGWYSSTSLIHPAGDSSTYTYNRIYPIPITTVDTRPSTTSGYDWASINPTVVTTDHINKYVDIQYYFGTDKGNWPEGIQSMSFQHGPGHYQMGFNPPIPKTNAEMLELTVRVSYSNI